MLESSDLIQSTIKVCRLDGNKLIFKPDQIIFRLNESKLRARKAGKGGKKTSFSFGIDFL